MKEEFPARILRIHFGESDKWNGKPLYEALYAKCQELGMASAIVYRGIEGYGGSTRIHHSSHWKFSHDAPLILCVVDAKEQLAKLLPHLDEMVGDGLIAVSDVDVIRYSLQEDASPES